MAIKLAKSLRLIVVASGGRDFNLIRKVENCNKLRGNLTLMMEFNLTISQLGIQAILING
jgi:hypothetical protein